ncbi:MAG: AmmeMemoRadiSam system protein B [Gammaproteobacteria bacterium]
MTVRKPAVSGLFYSADKDALRRDVDAMLDAAHATGQSVPKAIIAPHAGFRYSGPVAASAYKLLEPARQRIRRVLLLGPAHRVYLDGMALSSAEGFATPLGTVPLDRDLLATIAALPDVCVSDKAHRDEHCIEVQLPFLQTVLAEFSLAPVVVGRCAAEPVAAVIDAAWGGPETLIVISSDLSHYHPYDEARRIDAQTCSRIVASATDLGGGEACGAHAINGLMATRGSLDLRVDAIDTRNSGDTSGTRDRVVGYGSFVLH